MHASKQSAFRRYAVIRGAAIETLETRLLMTTGGTYTITVNDASDALDNSPTVSVSQLGSKVTLRDAINAANNTQGKATIVLAKTTYDFTTADNNWYGPNALPPIESSITIQGNGATLQRDASLPQTTAGEFRFFYVSGGIKTELPLGTLTLQNLTMTNGLAKGGDSFEGGGGAGMGGAIFNQGNTTLSGVTLYNNTAHGGNSANDMLIHYGDNDDFTDNFASGGGGIGQDAPYNTSAPYDDTSETAWGGGFGGNFPAGVYGGKGNVYSGTGGGFDADGSLENSGGYSGLGGDNAYGQGAGGDGGNGEFNGGDAQGGDFGFGGQANDIALSGDQGSSATAGGGGGVGGGGAAGDGFHHDGGNGGFGAGGGAAYFSLPEYIAPDRFGGNGGFGGGGGGGTVDNFAGVGGFGGGNGQTVDYEADAESGGGGAGMGGAVFSMYGSLTVVNSTLTANTAQGGSAFPVGGFSNLQTDSTGGSGYGGAIFNLDGVADIESSTIADNIVTGGEGGDGSTAGYGGADGGALYNLAFGSNYDTGAGIAASATINNSILYGTTSGISGNTSGAKPNDLVNFEQNTEFVSDSEKSPQPNNGDPVSVTGTAPNIIGTNSTNPNDSESIFSLPGMITKDPKLGPLASNGGPTMTLLPQANSPATDAGSNAAIPSGITTDQRGVGYPRIQNSTVDLGAIEATVAIKSFTVDNGTAQRSRVRTFTITFTTPVTLDTGAFTLTRTTGGSTNVTYTTASSNGGTTYVITPTNGTTGVSLIDGNYSLVVHTSAVHPVSSPSLPLGGSDVTYTFFRLFGDSNGDGTVNLLDYRAFAASYLKSSGVSGYNFAFDTNNDGTINLVDYRAFAANYLKTITA